MSLSAYKMHLKTKALKLFSGSKATDWGILGLRSIFQAENNTGFVKVVSIHLHFHHIADGNFDKILTQLTGNMG